MTNVSLDPDELLHRIGVLDVLLVRANARIAALAADNERLRAQAAEPTEATPKKEVTG